eukprot:m.252910 g.252910  ORF g.252910 m.252910 type:complete len:439 (-) comp17191_c0_seq15:1990-3306(-)
MRFLRSSKYVDQERVPSSREILEIQEEHLRDESNWWYFSNDDGGDALTKMCQWILKLNHHANLWAHNARSYDAYLLMARMSSLGHPPNQEFCAGQKVIQAAFRVKDQHSDQEYTVRLRDSLSFFTTSLAKLPKAVGINARDLNLEKDHFPHDFHRLDTQWYNGPLPDRSFWGKLSDVEWAQLELKYANGYDLRSELIKYCRQDVRVLAVCMAVFQGTGLELTGMDPLSCPTAASYAMKSFRGCFMEEGSIPTLSEEHASFARKAYSGGRTEKFSTFWTNNPAELDNVGIDPDKKNELKRFIVDKTKNMTIYSVDVCSLYPSRMFNCPMPTGRPKTYIGEENLPEGWEFHEGIVQLDVYPPENKPPNWIPFFQTKAKVDKDDPYTRLVFPAQVMKSATITMAEYRYGLHLGYSYGAVERFDDYGPGNSDLFKEFIRTFP